MPQTPPHMPELLMIGCGRMGGALLRGWLEKKAAFRFSIITPHPDRLPEVVSSHPHVTAYASWDDLPAGYVPDLLLWAVKPQILPELLPHAADHDWPDCLHLSIAAGKTLAFFAHHLGSRAPVIRIMPNTPALIGEGMSTLVAGETASAAHRQQAAALMQAVGHAVWLETEEQMDAATALAGSGPAYVFAFMESLARAGEAAGLPSETAAFLARYTVTGAAALAAQSPQTPAALREEVTSPGGTTAAGLSALLEAHALDELLSETLRRAADRSRELSG